MPNGRDLRRSAAIAGTLVAALAATVVLGHDQKPRSDVPMTRPEECLAVVDGVGRAAGFLELADGAIMMQRGSEYRVSRDGGVTWSEPKPLVGKDGKTLRVGAGSLVRFKDGALGLAGLVSTSKEFRGSDINHMAFWRSEDGGQSWQAMGRISEPSRHVTSVLALHDSLLQTSSGRLILPVAAGVRHARDLFHQDKVTLGLRDNQLISIGAHDWPQDGFSWCYAYYSDDEGRTWKSSRGGDIYVRDDSHRMWESATEPTIAEVEPGKILMLVRTNLGRLYKSWSFDNGESWTAPTPTPLAASNAPAQLRTIPGTGDLVVVWNQASEEEIRKGLKRARLSSAVSRTNGAIWEFFQNVESVLEGTRVEAGPIFYTVPEGDVYGPTAPATVRDPRFTGELPPTLPRVSYPSVFFYKDRVLIGHTNQHFSEKEGKIVSPGRIRVLPISWLYGGKQNMRPAPYDLKKRFPIRDTSSN